jgi:hypothetical protein
MQLKHQKIPSFPLIPFDSTLIAPFFCKISKLKYLKPEVVQLYKTQLRVSLVWQRGMNEFSSVIW